MRKAVYQLNASAAQGNVSARSSTKANTVAGVYGEEATSKQAVLSVAVIPSAQCHKQVPPAIQSLANATASPGLVVHWNVTGVLTVTIRWKLTVVKVRNYSIDFIAL